MPKDEIDYSNTIIYKISCKNKNITDFYIGHTTNFTKRKCLHKQSCNNINNNKLKIYDIIRKNGYWNNWEMTEIAKYNCKNSAEACIKEQEHVDKHMLLNTPITDESDNVATMMTNAADLSQKSLQNYLCKKCNYDTCKKTDFDKHNLTSKHLNIAKMMTIAAQNSQCLKNVYECNCGKQYSHRQSLSVHKKKCEIIEKTEENIKSNEPTDKELIMILIKENSELKNMMMKVIENGTHNVTNSNNKAFNLNFFLNETCKDAMNIMDFVDSIKLQLTDLESVGKLGYVEGISNIIVKNLKELDVTQRPVHCTDKKRETLYVKDENKWEKDETKQKMHKLVKKVASKNARLLPKFKEAHPDCSKSVSKFSDQYNKIIVESMGGSGDNDFEKEEKIINKISKEIMVEK